MFALACTAQQFAGERASPRARTHARVGERVKQRIACGAGVVEPQAQAEGAVGHRVGPKQAEGPDREQREPAGQEAAQHEADRLGRFHLQK